MTVLWSQLRGIATVDLILWLKIWCNMKETVTTVPLRSCEWKDAPKSKTSTIDFEEGDFAKISQKAVKERTERA